MTLDELIQKVSRIERERDLYRSALGKISRYSDDSYAREVSDAVLMTGKEMRERGSGD